MAETASILIPCYNAERWVAQAIESALAQTWSAKDVVVVDDGSTDGSLDVIRGFGSRIRWETGPNRGGNNARNRLLHLARGDWIQYLDADDYLFEDKVRQQMEFFVGNQSADAIYGPVTLEHWSETGKRLELLPIPQGTDGWELLARWLLPQTGAVLWRKQALLDVGGWKPDQPCCQEHELYLRLLIAGKRLVYCASPGAVYRQWSDTTVCRRDVPRVHRERLAIEQRMEVYLRQHNLLTPSRLTAINQARFETARIAWEYNPVFAAAIMQVVRSSQPGFRPGGGAAPSKYRAMYRCFGFAAAQRLASWNRRIFRTRQVSVLARGS
jgi:glycosyltransferase involved in cell wall biosynthesis